MEFKKESDCDQRNLAAGVIIDNFLSEEAEYYLSDSVQAADGQTVQRLIQVYE
jgi:hypothetical protein